MRPRPVQTHATKRAQVDEGVVFAVARREKGVVIQKKSYLGERSESAHEEEHTLNQNVTHALREATHKIRIRNSFSASSAKQNPTGT